MNNESAFIGINLVYIMAGIVGIAFMLILIYEKLDRKIIKKTK